MKVTVLPTREKGVAFQRGELKRVPTLDGELEIVDIRHESYNRIIKIARLDTGYNVKELLEVHVVWASGGRICFAGFERVKEDNRITDFAQSWICLLNGERGYDNEGLLQASSHESKRFRP